MRRMLLVSVIVLLLSPAFMSVCHAVEKSKQQGMTSEIYIGPYMATRQGRVKLPKEVTWEARSAYNSVDEQGNRYEHDCVSLVLSDAGRKFWAVIIKMDIPAARDLVDQLEEVLISEEEGSRHSRKMFGMQCVFDTSSYEITPKGKIVLPGNTHWKVFGRYAGELSGNMKAKGGHVLLVLEEKQESKKQVRPLVCTMDMVSVSRLISTVSRTIGRKEQVASIVSK